MEGVLSAGRGAAFCSFLLRLPVKSTAGAGEIDMREANSELLSLLKMLH